MEVYSFDMVYPKMVDERIHYIQGDFFDDNILKQVVEGMDIIYHSLSTVNPGNSNEKYMMGYSRDFVQTVKLCSMIKDSQTKLIFLSSGGTVYGKQEIQPITEDAVARPINHYGNVKLCIENTMRIFDIQANSKMLIARISNPYGPGQDFTKGVGFIDAVIKRAIKGESVEIWGDGSVVRDYIYIDDVVAMLYSLSLYEGDEIVFNISSGVGVSQNEIIGIVKKLHGSFECLYKEGRSVDVKSIVLDNSCFLNNVSMEKLTSLDEGIEKYYNFLMGDCMREKL
jgi:UDP-glucose 4-epimerase